MSNRKKALIALFCAYCAMLLWLLLLRRIGGSASQAGLNLRPLETIRTFATMLVHGSSRKRRLYAAANLLGNVGLFVPMGVILPILFTKMRPFLATTLCSTVVISAVELLQVVSGLGVCDVDDLLLNLLGVWLGWLAWKLWQWQNNRRKNKIRLPDID